MSRDKTGKNQETGQVQQNNAVRDQSLAQVNRGMQWANNDIIDLQQNPGFRPEDLAAMKASAGAKVGAAYQGAEDQLARRTAQSGHLNDSGLYPQLKELAREKTRMATGKNLDYDLANANEVLATRRALPGMVKGVNIDPYAGFVTGGMGNNTSLINQREQIDNTRPFWEDLSLAAMNSGGQVGAAELGKKS